MDQLSERQREIALLVATGASNKQIARQLELSEKTIKNQLTLVFRKLNVECRTQAALWVVRQTQASTLG